MGTRGKRIYLNLVFITFSVLGISRPADMGDSVHWGSTDIRYTGNCSELTDDGEVAQTASVKAWRGEEIDLQAVFASSGGIDSLMIRPGKLVSGKSVIPESAVMSGFVGYVMTDGLNKDGSGGCGFRINSDYDSSYVADPIDFDASSIKVAKNSMQPVWIKIKVPEDAVPGTYSGKILFADGDDPISSLSIELEVSGRALPEENVFHLDLWQNPYSVARYFNVEPFSSEHFEFMRPTMQQYADAGGKVITTSIIHKPWNGQTYDPFESMVTWLKKADGTWWFDYTVFDMWVEFMLSLGVDEQINCYSMIPWQLSFQYFDQASNSFRYLAAEPGDPEYEEFWSAMLHSFSAHLRDNGWFDITMIAMDERPMEHMLAAIEVIKNADPEFKISFAGKYHDELLDSVDDYCIPIEDSYPCGTAVRRRKAGKMTTCYTSCAESWPNTFTFSHPAEAEWIGWYMAARGLDGYLRWAFNSWPADPMHDSRFTSWAAGDTYLVYPGGVSSIRFEKLKAGITAYRKISALEAEFLLTGNSNGLEAIDKLLSMFVYPDTEMMREITDASSDKDLASDTLVEARKILDSLSFDYQ